MSQNAYGFIPKHAIVELTPLSIIRVLFLHLQQSGWIVKRFITKQFPFLKNLFCEGPTTLRRDDKPKVFLFYKHKPNRILGSLNLNLPTCYGYIKYGHRLAWGISAWDANDLSTTAELIRNKCQLLAAKYNIDNNYSNAKTFFRAAKQALFYRRLRKILVVLTLMPENEYSSPSILIGSNILQTSVNDHIWELPMIDGKSMFVLNYVARVLPKTYQATTVLCEGMPIHNLEEILPYIIWGAITRNLSFQAITYKGVTSFIGDHAWGTYNVPLWFIWCSLVGFSVGYGYPEMLKEPSISMALIVVVRVLLFSSVCTATYFVLCAMLILMGHWQEAKIERMFWPPSDENIVVEAAGGGIHLELLPNNLQQTEIELGKAKEIIVKYKVALYGALLGLGEIIAKLVH